MSAPDNAIGIQARFGEGKFEAPDSVGVVVIGRNEGERLRRCLESIPVVPGKVVYVDSGSTDGSLEMAASYGVEWVELDMSIPFCAARARNAGYRKLVESHPRLAYVQFIDGDCEIVGDWLSCAVNALEARHHHAIVAGWIHEKSPHISIYNRLGDLEWNFSGSGEVNSVGGIFLIRREAFDSIGGFDPTVTAGEEPELCQRLIRQGWGLVRLDKDMALHDLAMTRFGHWWRRMLRNGYGSLDVAIRFGIEDFVSSIWKVRAWSVWFALVVAGWALVAAVPGSNEGLTAIALVTALWPVQWLRVAARTWRSGQPVYVSSAYAFFIMIAFLPQMAGQFIYFADRLQKRTRRLVEYKSSGSSGPAGDKTSAGTGEQ